jgi:hypothetical protein
VALRCAVAATAALTSDGCKTASQLAAGQGVQLLDHVQISGVLLMAQHNAMCKPVVGCYPCPVAPRLAVRLAS